MLGQIVCPAFFRNLLIPDLTGARRSERPAPLLIFVSLNRYNDAPRAFTPDLLWTLDCCLWPDRGRHLNLSGSPMSPPKPAWRAPATCPRPGRQAVSDRGDGGGVALFDFDNDGWLDIFLVNGSSFQGAANGRKSTSYLFRNNRDGTFTDVTRKAGLTYSGWGQGCCVGDYDNDGFDDLFVSYWGRNVLYHNNGNGTFTNVSEKAGVAGPGGRWGAGCCFLDYDRDGRLDLFVANYVHFDPKQVPRAGEAAYCRFNEIPVPCGRRGWLAARTFCTATAAMERSRMSPRDPASPIRGAVVDIVRAAELAAGGIVWNGRGCGGLRQRRLAGYYVAATPRQACSIQQPRRHVP